MHKPVLDTIFAKASGAGRAAIAVVRLSGERCGEVLARMIQGRLPPPRVATLRRLRDPESRDVLDKAMLLWFPGPHSYTGEDVAELHLHGGPAILASVSKALVALGCRPAEPGEFTRRAFLHGKLDLTQAEAVADLIDAETDAQRRQALRQAEGGLSRLYGDWTTRMTRILAHQEAAIEFEMDDLPSDLDRQAASAAGVLAAEIDAHLDDARRGERLREGLSIAILGAPNAGKSSLLNALLGRDAAIVSAQPGTTRDVVETWLDLGGIPARIADTAGLRITEDEVEREGVRRARLKGEEADLVLAAFAADQSPDAETLGLLRERSDALVVITKADLGGVPEALPAQPALLTSARDGTGLTALRAALAREAERRAGLTEVPSLTRARHRAALLDASQRLEEARRSALPEVAAEGYRAALVALGRLTGRVEVETVLDAVFRDFCIGK